MKNNLHIYCCPACGSISISSGNMKVSCCNAQLQRIEVIDSLPPRVTAMDGEYFLEFNNPMTKQEYIAAVVVERYDRVELIRLFPEQEASVRIPIIQGVTLYTVFRKEDKVWAERSLF